MIRGIRPLLRGSTYSGALFAYCGALVSFPLLPFAMLPALLLRQAPYAVQAVLALLVWAALVAAVGLARTTRRVLITCTRRLLKVPLPDPAAPSPALPSAAGRWRTPLWLLLHVALGWTGGLASVLLLGAAVALPGGWTSGDAGLTLFGRSVQVEGRWSWVAALGCLLLAVAVCVLIANALRWLAPRLLGRV
ncbi:hypothetical protein [Kitasatospora mediocidica]|uniref:hypothetical protein n=1 Tax=Kitasatospora mediocidica TaxID=58352 RepID=UPI00068DF272|nr:hypothetical protein [Kitasatospora mediocidica]